MTENKKLTESKMQQLSDILNALEAKIAKLKDQAAEKNLFEIAVSIVKALGDYDDWGGGQYSLYSPLHINYTSSQYIVIMENSQIVFRANGPQTNDVDIYIPGKWEEILRQLKEKTETKSEQNKESAIQKQIAELKHKFGVA
jgi:hypothetical protein